MLETTPDVSVERPPLVNGVHIDPIGPAQLGARIEMLLADGDSHVVHFVCAHPTVVARQEPSYRRLLNRGDLNLADGLPVTWTLHLLGYDAERITGTDGMRMLCAWGRCRKLRHFLYGGTPQVLDGLRSRLEDECAGVSIVGAASPPFRPLSDVELRRDAQRIRSTQADLVWVGLGTPKQDVVAERLRELEAAPVILCVGAAFDFLSGQKRRAPGWMQAVGLEWLFRLVREPRRLWRRYLIGNPAFAYGVASDLLRRRAVRRP